MSFLQSKFVLRAKHRRTRAEHELACSTHESVCFIFGSTFLPEQEEIPARCLPPTEHSLASTPVPCRSGSPRRVSSFYPSPLSLFLRAFSHSLDTVCSVFPVAKVTPREMRLVASVARVSCPVVLSLYCSSSPLSLSLSPPSRYGSSLPLSRSKVQCVV